MPNPNLDILAEAAPWCTVESTDPAIRKAYWQLEEYEDEWTRDYHAKCDAEMFGCFSGLAGATG